MAVAFAMIGTALTVAGVVLIVGGNPLVGAILILLGLAAGAIAAAISIAKKGALGHPRRGGDHATRQAKRVQGRLGQAAGGILQPDDDRRGGIHRRARRPSLRTGGPVPFLFGKGLGEESIAGATPPATA